MDEYNEHRIHQLCPNLTLYSNSKPWHQPMSGTLENSADPKRITHLEISLPTDSLSCYETKWIELPELQTLMLYSERSARFPPWRMHQLRCLILQGFRIPNVSEFKLPEHSPHINTIELMMGDYRVIDFFNRDNSPLRHYEELLSLTITTVTDQLDERDHLPRSSTPSLSFLKSIVRLCIPYLDFVYIDRIISFPPRLTDLVLLGHASDGFAQTVGLFRLQDVSFAKRNKSLEGRPHSLQRVRVVLFGADKEGEVELIPDGPDLTFREISGFLYNKGKSESHSQSKADSDPRFRGYRE